MFFSSFQHSCRSIPGILAFLWLACATALAQPVSQISARVVGPDGAPVEGAQIGVIAKADFPNLLNGGQQATRLLTDANGVFSFDWKESAILPQDWPAPLDTTLALVRIVAKGLATTEVLLQKNGQIIPLSRGRKYEGIAQGENGKPVAGLALKVTYWPSLAQSALSKNQSTANFAADIFNVLNLPSPEAITDTDGHFEIWAQVGDAENQTAYALLSDPRFELRLYELPLERLATIKVKPGASVIGRIIDRQGQPVAGLQVGLSSDGFLSVDSDKEGRFQLDSLPLNAEMSFGRTLVASKIQKNGDYNRISAYLELPKLQAGLNPLPDWKWAPTLVKGQVVDADSKQPLQATLQYVSGNAGFSAATDKDGRFSITVDSSAPLSVIVQDMQQNHLDLNRKWKNLGDKDEFDLGFLEMTPSSVTPLWVRDEDGAPATGTRIKFFYVNGRNEEGQEFYAVQEFEADKDGKTQISRVPAGTYTVQIPGVAGGSRGVDISEGWEILDLKQITILPAGKPTKPLEIWVRRKAKP